MSVFPSSAHLASWAGQCPGNHESAGKRRSGKSRKGSKWLQTTLNESAKAAARSKGTYLSAQYTRLRGLRGPRKATGALRHSILIAVYHILERKVPYQELGADYFEQRRSLEHRTKRLVRQLQQLGHGHPRAAHDVNGARTPQPTKEPPFTSIFTLRRQLRASTRAGIP